MLSPTARADSLTWLATWINSASPSLVHVWRALGPGLCPQLAKMPTAKRRPAAIDFHRPGGLGHTRRMRLTPDLEPLRSREFRLLWSGQAVSYFGSMITFVALPYQVYRLTGSSFAVGMLGACELAPLIALALLGGALADAFDRRRVFIVSQVALMATSLLLAANAALTHPYVWALFALASISAAMNGLGRPSLTAMIPRLIEPSQVPAAVSLTSLSGTLGFVGGAAAGGLLVGAIGLSATYAVDVGTFAASLLTLAMMSAIPAPEDAARVGLRSIVEGLRFLRGRPVLQGTYIIDFIAMIFGMPKALFPALAAHRFGGGPRVVGLLFAAPALGAFLATATSGWTGRVHRHGLAITLGVAAWGAAIIVFGLTSSLPLALLMLGVAGAGDMISGVFRMIVWTQTIPDNFRGRLAGIEWANVASGPLLGDVEAGVVASWRGPQFSVVSGGVACLVGVALMVACLPAFVAYDAPALDPDPLAA